MIRDAAYARISKDARADLHERYATWLDTATAGREGEFDEIVGYHLEQTSHLRAELAPGDERAREAGARAAARLGAAGGRAFDRGDLRAAASLLGRADAFLPPDSVERIPILLDLGVVHEGEGRFDDALVVLGTAEALARGSGDVGAAARAVARRQQLRSHVEGAPLGELRAEVEAMLPELERIGDDAAIAESCLFLGVSFMYGGQSARAVEQLEHASQRSARSGGPRRGPEPASWIPVVMMNGPMPASSVHARWAEISASTTLSRYARAFGDLFDAESLAMTGELEAARSQCGAARAAIFDLGDESTAAATVMVRGYIELLAGDPAAAERMLAEGDRQLSRLGEEGFRSTVLCLLADARQAIGRPDEAIAATTTAEEIAPPEDFETDVGWRGARARALADHRCVRRRRTLGA